jgi:hypothetical protein
MLQRATRSFLIHARHYVGGLFFCMDTTMVKKPQTLRMWLDMLGGDAPIILWWEPIDPNETIFRVSTSFGVYIIRNFKGEIIAEKDSSWCTS